MQSIYNQIEDRILRQERGAIIFPDDIIDALREGYETMREKMIYGESLPFDRIVELITELNAKFNNLKWYY